MTERQEQAYALIKGNPQIGIGGLKKAMGIKSNSYVGRLVESLVGLKLIGKKPYKVEPFEIYEVPGSIEGSTDAVVSGPRPDDEGNLDN